MSDHVHSGTVSIRSKVNQFYEAIRRGEIMVTNCTKCGASYLPPRADCSKCYSSEMAWKKLDSAKGRIMTFTTISTPPESFEGHQPYTCAVVELEQGIKVLGWVHGIEPARMRIGLPVKVLPGELGGERPGFKVVEA